MSHMLDVIYRSCIAIFTYVTLLFDSRPYLKARDNLCIKKVLGSKGTANSLLSVSFRNLSFVCARSDGCTVIIAKCA
jgi:hypothetical protein